MTALQKSLPAAPGGSQPLPEGLLWLLLSGDVPTKSQVEGLSANLRGRSKLPDHVLTMLASLPTGTHPMTQFSMAVMALQPASKFAQAYQDGARPAQIAPSPGVYPAAYELNTAEICAT